MLMVAVAQPTASDEFISYGVFEYITRHPNLGLWYANLDKRQHNVAEPPVTSITLKLSL